jgi:hypothetical protein
MIIFIINEAHLFVLCLFRVLIFVLFFIIASFITILYEITLLLYTMLLICYTFNTNRYNFII